VDFRLRLEALTASVRGTHRFGEMRAITPQFLRKNETDLPMDELEECYPYGPARETGGRDQLRRTSPAPAGSVLRAVPQGVLLR